MNLMLYHRLYRSSAPQAERISLAEAKLFLRVDTDVDDVLISELIVAARIFAEQYLGTSLVVQQWTVEFTHLTPKELLLPMPPVASITSVSLRKADMTETLLDVAAYTLIAPDRLLFLESEPANLLRIVYQTEEFAFDEGALKQAMLHHIALCYELRSSSAPLPAQSQQIYHTYKAWRI